MMRNLYPALTLLGAALTYAAPAASQSLTGNVGSAAITAGEQAVEFRAGFADDGSAGARIHFDKAFNDWYQLRVIGSFARPDGSDWEYSGLTFENWFQWREEGRDTSDFNGGLRLAYTFADGGGPDEAEVRVTTTDKFGSGWEWRANIIGEIETGDGSVGGVEIETRAQITRALSASALGASDWRLGLEILSELGNTRDMPGIDDQAHQAGPVAKASWDNGVYLQTALRFGLTDASDDAMFKIFLGREF